MTRALPRAALAARRDPQEEKRGEYFPRKEKKPGTKKPVVTVPQLQKLIN